MSSGSQQKAKLEDLFEPKERPSKPHTKIGEYYVYNEEIGFNSIKKGQKFVDRENSRFLNLLRQRGVLLTGIVSIPVSSGILATTIGLRSYDQYHIRLRDYGEDILIAQKGSANMGRIPPFAPLITLPAGFVGGLGINYMLGADSFSDFIFNPYIVDLVSKLF